MRHLEPEMNRKEILSLLRPGFLAVMDGDNVPRAEYSIDYDADGNVIATMNGDVSFSFPLLTNAEVSNDEYPKVFAMRCTAAAFGFKEIRRVA